MPTVNPCPYNAQRPLRAIEADRPDRIAPELHERLRTLATSAGRSTRAMPTAPSSPARCAAARADVEAMFRRLGADDQTDEGDPAITAARADVEAIIARQGFIG
jgi:hypothetical protein